MCFVNLTLARTSKHWVDAADLGRSKLMIGSLDMASLLLVDEYIDSAICVARKSTDADGD